MSVIRAVATHAVLFLGLSATDLGAIPMLPNGFSMDRVGYGPFAGLPVGFAFLPDGRIVVIELDTGNVRLNPVGAQTSALIHTIPDVVSGGERGLLGVAVDPDWPIRPYLYFYFTHSSGKALLIMLSASGDLTDSSSTSITLADRFDLLTDIRDEVDIHNGGTLRFGPDRMLYLSLGDDGWGCSSQNTSLLTGGILRLDVSSMPDSSSGPPPKSALAPADNPLAGAGENEALFWTWGLRNPFRFGIDETNGDIVAGDVGVTDWEEVNHIPYAGGGGDNFGWPHLEGPDSTGIECEFVDPSLEPAYMYPHNGQSAIIGGPIYRAVEGASTKFPQLYEGNYFFVDFFQGWIRRLEVTGGSWNAAPPAAGQPSAENWGEGFLFYTDFQQGPDGALYLCHMEVEGLRPKGVYRIFPSAPTSAEAASDPPAGTIRAVPNPSRVGGVVRFHFPEGSGVSKLEIFDVAGRLVRTLNPENVEADGSLRWDGRFGSGRAAAPGLYFYRPQKPLRGVAGGKLVLLP